jgi:anti-anti-sigma factor
LVFGTLQGIVVAIIVSLLGLASQAVNPVVHVLARKPGADVLRPLSSKYPQDETFEGLLILRPEGRLFFANAAQVHERIKALISQYQPRVVTLDLSRVPDIEFTALQMLVESEKRLGESNITLWLAGLNPPVLKAVREIGLADRLGRERMLFSVHGAMERFCALDAGTAAS